MQLDAKTSKKDRDEMMKGSKRKSGLGKNKLA
jgi:hypothetical protein